MTEEDKGAARLPLREVAPWSEGRGRPTKEQQEAKQGEFEALVVLGLNNSEIARRLGVTLKTVRKWRHQSNRPVTRMDQRPQIKKTDVDRFNAEALRLYSEGLTYVEIAEALGVSYVTVRNRLKVVYKEYAIKMRDEIAGQQFADIQMMKAELLELIVRDHREDLQQIVNEGSAIDIDDDAAIKVLAEKAFNKGRKNVDTKLAAIDRYVKLMEREAKLFGADAAERLDVNVQHTVKPEAIELLQRLEGRAVENAVDAEIIEDFDLGNPEN